ncbi:hypothetical protein QVN97_11320 [Bacteroides caecigallinarum]|nr:hypothetical protein [Bacteroides caecigallinarum]
MALPTCYCHLWISPPAKSLRIGLLNSNLISCHRDIYCVAYMGASKSNQTFRCVSTLKDAVLSFLKGDLNQTSFPLRDTGICPISSRKPTREIRLICSSSITR